MRKLLVLFSLLVLTAAPGWAAKGKLNLFIWSEYIDPQIIKDFEKQFDCDVTVDLYEDNESMVAKLQGGGVALYDIVVPSDYIILSMRSQALLAKLRPENIPNLKNLDPQFTNREYDPGNQYTVPYQWGTIGIYIRREKGETIDETWGILFDPAKQVGSFLLMDDPRSTIGAALRYQGHSVNSTDKKQLKQARDVLLATKKRSLGFEGGVGGKNKVLARVCKAAVVYNGDAVRGTKEDADTYYFIPREGSEIWLDNMAIPAKAPHRDLAEKFINFILDAKVGAQLSNWTQYPTPNKAALEFIKPEDKQNPAIYPTPATMKNLEFMRDLGAKGPWYDELWTTIKAK
jgi:spermidine/putrescine transport system substrate-binding protein